MTSFSLNEKFSTGDLMRFIIIPFLTTFLILLSSPSQAARDVKSMSYPAISSDGSTVFFSAWGDIWSVPRDGSEPAKRLTDNVAYEVRPIISPDSTKIAFISDRWGNYDIFVMPIDGGASTRLTWSSNTDYIYDWKPDGSALLAYTSRQDLWGMCAYEIPLDGSQPVRLTGPDYDDHVFVKYLGDDKHLVYTRGPGDWARKHNKAQNTYDLWTFDLTTGNHKQITDYTGNDMWPQPTRDGSRIYFVSDRDGTNNIWVMEMSTGKADQLTHFKGDGTLWPQISGDNDEIICEVFGEIYIVSTKNGKTEKVPIRFSDDPKHEMILEQDIANKVSEYAISPNGNYYAVVVMGDIFILKNPDKYKDDEKPDQDLTRTFHVVDSPGREMHLSWHPKSTKLAYISDRDGQYDVYILDLVTHEEKRITDTIQDEWYPSFAPHGEKLAYYSGNRKLMLYYPDTCVHEILHEGQLKNGPYPLGYEWSPDGLWIAYCESILDSMTDIFIINTEDKKTVDITLTPDYDSSPSWSPDGKYLAYYTNFEDASRVMLLELDPKKEKYDTVILFPDDLKNKEDEKKKDDEKIKEKENGEKKEPTPEEKKDDVKTDSNVDEIKDQTKPEEEKKEEEIKPVTIDFTRIHLRAQSIVEMEGNSYDPWFAPTSDYLVFQTEHEGKSWWWSYTIKEKGFEKLKNAENTDNPKWSPDGKRLHFLSNNRIDYLDMNGAKSSGAGSLPTTNKMIVDQYQIWNQMLNEGWRHIRDSYYDKNLHGTDWNEVLKRYLPRVKDCGTVYEYSNLYRLMLGELNSSHLGYYTSNNDREAPSDSTADFGVLFDEKFDGTGWKITKVINNSPADKPGSKLYVGDIILKINEHEIASKDNRDFLMMNLVDKPTTLLVKNSPDYVKPDEKEDDDKDSESKDEKDSKPEDKKNPDEREVIIKPTSISSMWQLLYEQWVEDNKKLVDDKTKGEIGYIHIQAMYNPSLQKFRRELFSENIKKKALIIDVRFNGGGYTAVDVVDLLDRKPAYIHQHRGSQPGFRPPLTWHGPIVLLINAESFSNAEILSHIMRDLGLATIIGESTGGGVISTYDFRLLDSSGFRMPSWLNARLNGTDMEWNGAVPDIFIHIDPKAVAEGRDNQLDAAIDYLIKKIK